jgi:hypothetical protein
MECKQLTENGFKKNELTTEMITELCLIPETYSAIESIFYEGDLLYSGDEQIDVNSAQIGDSYQKTSEDLEESGIDLENILSADIIKYLKASQSIYPENNFMNALED